MNGAFGFPKIVGSPAFSITIRTTGVLMLVLDPAETSARARDVASAMSGSSRHKQTLTTTGGFAKGLRAFGIGFSERQRPYVIAVTVVIAVTAYRRNAGQRRRSSGVASAQSSVRS
jgi:hypothetical protein